MAAAALAPTPDGLHADRSSVKPSASHVDGVLLLDSLRRRDRLTSDVRQCVIDAKHHGTLTSVQGNPDLHLSGLTF